MKAIKYWSLLLLLLIAVDLMAGLQLSKTTKITIDKATNNYCKNVNESLNTFRDNCFAITCLTFKKIPWSIKQKWCQCLEKKFDLKYLTEKDCSSFRDNQFELLYSNNLVNTECGTPDTPKDK